MLLEAAAAAGILHPDALGKAATAGFDTVPAKVRRVSLATRPMVATIGEVVVLVAATAAAGRSRELSSDVAMIQPAATGTLDKAAKLFQGEIRWSQMM
mmetsp:Transcript_82924/g.173625  ORF Transcript_82924/g.173625 Transcript_82924/m.173625 type:complete len:98 (+) Transcript_82924:752-1045(+)